MLTVNHNEKLKSVYIFLSLGFRDPRLMYNFSLWSLDMPCCYNSSAYIALTLKNLTAICTKMLG